MARVSAVLSSFSANTYTAHTRMDSGRNRGGVLAVTTGRRPCASVSTALASTGTRP